MDSDTTIELSINIPAPSASPERLITLISTPERNIKKNVVKIEQGGRKGDD